MVIDSTATQFFTVKQFCIRYPAFNEGGLRHLIFHAETNGFATAFKRVGRKVLINEAEFLACIERQNQPPEPLPGKARGTRRRSPATTSGRV